MAAVVAESVMNLACVGARPLGLVNCLNFGNPEHPEVMWQFSEVIDGMGEVCRALGIPVSGGNVSFYNESRGSDIDPSPVIGMLGLVDELTRRPAGVTLVDGHDLLLIGTPASSLDGSLWAWRRSEKVGMPPALDLDAFGATADVVRAIVNDDLVSGVHDLADGLAVALAEMSAASGVGVVVEEADLIRAFGETPSAVVACVAPETAAEVLRRCAGAGVAVEHIGRAVGATVSIGSAIDTTVDQLTTRWRDRLPVALGSGTAQG
jgi:phosphoribosylformylglycinamidine synthase